jgi:selenocysteine lyase/cysteine desulfurase
MKPNETLDSFHKNYSLRHEIFPILHQQLFLGHAGVCILPLPSVSVMQNYLEFCSQQMQESPEIWREVHQTRVIAAQLLNAKTSEIALLGPTSLGLSLVAAGLDWQPNDEVIYYAEDYPANVYPWKNLESKSVKAITVTPAVYGHVTLADVQAKITPRTKLVSLASAHYLTGYRIDYAEIGAYLRSHNILFCLDAIQTLGAFPVDAQYIDFLSADSHKWLLGPMCAGIFYVREACQDLLKPVLLGSWNVQSPEFIAQEQIIYESGARRYEPGVLNIGPILGMKKSIELLLSFGMNSISEHLLKLRSFLIQSLHELDFENVGPTQHAQSCGILSVVHSDSKINLNELHQFLLNEKIFCSLRQNRKGQQHLRFSPHFYQTEEDLQRLIEVLRKKLRS